MSCNITCKNQWQKSVGKVPDGFGANYEVPFSNNKRPTICAGFQYCLNFWVIWHFTSLVPYDVFVFPFVSAASQPIGLFVR